MAYNGWLLKIGDFTVDPYIKANSYKAYVNTQSMDAYEDANGVLHPEFLDHAPIKAEFTIIPFKTNLQFQSFMRQIRSNTTIAQGKKGRECTATIYVFEYDDYVTADCYIPDFEPSIYGKFDGDLQYNEFEMHVIEK